MKRPPLRWRTFWDLFVRGFKTLLPLPESKQERWSYRAAAEPPKRKRATSTLNKTTKATRSTKATPKSTTRKKAVNTKQSAGGHKGGTSKKAATTR